MAIEATTFSFASAIALVVFVQRLPRALHPQVRKIRLDMTIQIGLEEAQRCHECDCSASEPRQCSSHLSVSQSRCCPLFGGEVYIYIYIWGNCRGTGLDTANLRISSASPGVGDGCHCRKHSAKAALSRKALPGCLHSWSTCPRLARASRSSASQQLILENTSLERVMKALSEKYSNALTVPSEELVSIYSTSQLRSLHVVVGSHLL